MGAAGSIAKPRTKSGTLPKPPTTDASPAAAAAAAAAHSQRHFRVIDFSESPVPLTGVGRVIEPLHMPPSVPPPPPSSSGQLAWFVEDLDRPGDWDIYPPDTCARLDAALRAGDAECLIVSKKRACTVNLRRMEQSAAAGTRVRRVRRVSVEASVGPDGEKVLRERRHVAVDPFLTEGDAIAEDTAAADAENLDATQTLARTTRTITTTGALRVFPRILRSVVMQPLVGFTLAHAPKGRSLITAASGQFFQWDIDTATTTTMFDVEDAVVLTVAYSPSGDHVLCGAADNVVRLFNTTECKPCHRFMGHTRKVYGAGFFDGESRIATASMDCTLRYWDLETYSSINVEKCHTMPIFALATSKKCDWLAATGGDDSLICAHDFRIGNDTITTHFIGHTGAVWSCNWRHDELQFVSGGMDKTIRVWDMRWPTNPLIVIRHHTLAVHYAEFMPNGKGILSSSRDTTVRLTDAITGDGVWRATAHRACVFRAKYNASTGIMATCSKDGNVNIWEYENTENW